MEHPYNRQLALAAIEAVSLGATLQGSCYLKEDYGRSSCVGNALSQGRNAAGEFCAVEEWPLVVAAFSQLGIMASTIQISECCQELLVTMRALR